jgi:hypothetical protein
MMRQRLELALDAEEDEHRPGTARHRRPRAFREALVHRVEQLRLRVVEVGGGDDDIGGMPVCASSLVGPAQAGDPASGSAAARCCLGVDARDIGSRVQAHPRPFGQPDEGVDDRMEPAHRVTDTLVEVEGAHEVVDRRCPSRIGAEEDRGVLEDLAQHRIVERGFGEVGQRRSQLPDEFRERAEDVPMEQGTW